MVFGCSDVMQIDIVGQLRFNDLSVTEAVNGKIGPEEKWSTMRN